MILSCALKNLLRVDLTLSILNTTYTHTHKTIQNRTKQKKAKWNSKRAKETFGVMDMPITLLVVLLSWVCICIYMCVCVCVQTHQIVYFTYVQFFVYQLYLNKAVSGGIVKLLCIPEKICKVSNISVRPDA